MSNGYTSINHEWIPCCITCWLIGCMVLNTAVCQETLEAAGCSHATRCKEKKGCLGEEIPTKPLVESSTRFPTVPQILSASAAKLQDAQMVKPKTAAWQHIAIKTMHW